MQNWKHAAMCKKAEVLHALTHITDVQTMRTFVGRMDSKTVAELFHCLEYVDRATMQAWYTVFASLMKGE